MSEMKLQNLAQLTEYFLAKDLQKLESIVKASIDSCGDKKNTENIYSDLETRIKEYKQQIIP